MTKTTERIALVSPSPGTQRHLLAHRYGRPGARPKAYLQASIHADETPAMLVAHHLMKLLDEADAEGAIAGEIILVPVANPIGLSQSLNDHLLGRHEASGGGNFNRSWPDLYPTLPTRVAGKLGRDPARNIDAVRSALREIAGELQPGNEFSSLRGALTRLAVDADIVLDMHCDDEALMHLYLIPQHWPEARDLSAEIGSRATLLAADSGGHSFDETFSTPWTRLAAAVGPETPVPPACLAATIEYRGQADTGDEINRPDAQALFRFLQRRGLIAGDPGPLPKPLCDATSLDATEVLRSPVAGIVCYRRALGAKVAKGDVIAEILNPLAEDPSQQRLSLAAGTDGFLMTRRQHKMVRPGNSIGKIVGTEPLASRQGYLLED
ncbi:succinylglutamate desuccinylase [Hypericibacter terrae]|jgi:predicted deacylase|uniref:Succinylglutamate desuccinylase n=1 Tax=Hypericibacter terrae TaxID=2602015 RepID=A0A5J6MFE5_9PROT|nr:succinylglutamate desuccinylase/aspartoacylase family protein [Hypericibacter terrae]QEX15821.1 succinylglutamate desuccinylase [Hypericibacter terrae]